MLHGVTVIENKVSCRINSCGDRSITEQIDEICPFVHLTPGWFGLFPSIEKMSRWETKPLHKLAIFMEPTGRSYPRSRRRHRADEVGHTHRVEEDERPRRGDHIDMVPRSEVNNSQ